MKKKEKKSQWHSFTLYVVVVSEASDRDSAILPEPGLMEKEFWYPSSPIRLYLKLCVPKLLCNQIHTSQLAVAVVSLALAVHWKGAEEDTRSIMLFLLHSWLVSFEQILTTLKQVSFWHLLIFFFQTAEDSTSMDLCFVSLKQKPNNYAN